MPRKSIGSFIKPSEKKKLKCVRVGCAIYNKSAALPRIKHKLSKQFWVSISLIQQFSSFIFFENRLVLSHHVSLYVVIVVCIVERNANVSYGLDAGVFFNSIKKSLSGHQSVESKNRVKLAQSYFSFFAHILNVQINLRLNFTTGELYLPLYS